MLLSDNIQDLIEKMLDEGGGIVEVKRNDMAARLGCVPSQISYVITSRFTPARGYITQSKRGGGGCIRIVRVEMGREEYLMHFFHAIGDTLEAREAEAYLVNLRDKGIITDRETRLIAGAVLGSSLERVPPVLRNAVRADIFRHTVMCLMNSRE